MVDSLSVIIPVFNSEKSLGELYMKLTEALAALCKQYEIILVDDGSRDGSYAEICRLHGMDSRIKAIRLDGNFGQQNAVMCGLRQAAGGVIVTMDDDLQHPPGEIGRLLDKLAEGFDVVYGIPLENAPPGFRRLGARLRDLLFDRICRKPKGVKVSSFRAMKRAVAEKVAGDRTSFVYISAITLKHTGNIGNISFARPQRKYGRSSYDIPKLAGLFFRLLVNYGPLPLKPKEDRYPQYVIKETCLYGGIYTGERS